MSKNAYLGIKSGLSWLEKSVCLLKNCFFELLLNAERRYRPIEIWVSSYFFSSDLTRH